MSSFGDMQWRDANPSRIVKAHEHCKSAGFCWSTKNWLQHEISMRTALEAELRDHAARIHNQRIEINRLLDKIQELDVTPPPAAERAQDMSKKRKRTAKHVTMPRAHYNAVRRVLRLLGGYLGEMELTLHAWNGGTMDTLDLKYQAQAARKLMPAKRKGNNP